jgi:signal-transduction protein with cAMP-binding, CBS, and nucleotidyltransferase domain
MRYVKDILQRKGNKIFSIQSFSTVLNALKLMSEKNIGSMVVLDDSGKYIGLLTERDYARKVIVKGKSSDELCVSKIMSTDLPHIKLTDNIDYCMMLMANHNIRYLPVSEDNELKGIISVVDLMQENIIMHKDTNNHLESYIKGSYVGHGAVA